MTSFKDHFSARSADYARYRPGYPPALFDWLAAVAPARGLAWDVGTGSGQAALGLAAHFERVVASDAAEAQLRHAAAHPRITYKMMPAERSDLPDATVDLVSVAQALHWFDFERFYAEVRRVLKPGGVIAAWTYGLQRVDPEVDAVVRHYYREVVGPYWPPERRHVERQYRDVPFPFEEIASPVLTMQVQWSFGEVLGYLGTWSAARRYAELRGADPREEVRAALARAWGGAALRTVTWPLHLRVGRLPPHDGSAALA
jgi:ubiquinone/menaquinone biosynthesis C-methylase UbiE